MAHIQIKISMDMFFKVINAFTNSVRSSMNPDITTFNWCVWMKAQKGNLIAWRDSKHVHKLFTQSCNNKAEVM